MLTNVRKRTGRLLKIPRELIYMIEDNILLDLSNFHNFMGHINVGYLCVL